EQRLDDDAAIENAEARAVLRRRGVEIVGELEAAGARHVLHHHAGIAGHMTADMPRQHAAIEVVAAAGGIADQDLELLAAKEAFDILRRRRARPAERQPEEQDRSANP